MEFRSRKLEKRASKAKIRAAEIENTQKLLNNQIIERTNVTWLRRTRPKSLMANQKWVKRTDVLLSHIRPIFETTKGIIY